MSDNILFLFPDQWRHDCFGHVGTFSVDTPFLDALAAQGLAFDAAYSDCPICLPARNCLWTGKSPSTIGRMGYRDRVPWNYTNHLTDRLRKAGYQTLGVGKLHVSPQTDTLGFDELSTYEPTEYTPGFRSDYHAWLERESRGLVRDTACEVSNNLVHAYPWPHAEHFHPSVWTASEAIRLIAGRDPERPFFLYVGFHRPHPPFDPPLAWWLRYANREVPEPAVGDWARGAGEPAVTVEAISGRLPARYLADARRAYLAQCAHLDFQIGRILYSLGRLGLRESTTIVFSSDHGEMLGDHDMCHKARGFEASARVPLIIAPAGRQVNAPGEAWQRRSAPVLLSDLMPTFLELAGAEVTRDIESRSLVPLLDGPTAEWRDFVHGESSTIGNQQWVTDGRQKFIWEVSTGRELFFDLTNDPNECRNLADDPAWTATVDGWRNRLVEVLAKRPEDRLTDGRRLIPGQPPPVIRQWVLDGLESPAPTSKEAE